MAVNYTRLLQFFQQFGKFYTHQFSPFLARTGLSMREVHVLLFLANNPSYDTARDVTEFRGLSKSQVSQAVELLGGGADPPPDTGRGGPAGSFTSPSRRTARRWPGNVRPSSPPAKNGFWRGSLRRSGRNFAHFCKPFWITARS